MIEILKWKGIAMVNFKSFYGMVTQINDFMIGQNGVGEGCYKLMTVEDGVGGIVNFVVSPTTYFVNQEMVSLGDRITGYYDGDAPVPLIYPPQYQALVVVKENNYLNVKIDFFNNQLVSSDGQLKLNLFFLYSYFANKWATFFKKSCKSQFDSDLWCYYKKYSCSSYTL